MDVPLMAPELVFAGKTVVATVFAVGYRTGELLGTGAMPGFAVAD